MKGEEKMKLTKKQKDILRRYGVYRHENYMGEVCSRHRFIVRKLRMKGLLPPEKPLWLKFPGMGHLFM
jgi:hypothetical protein